MKFGDELSRAAVAEWRGHYFDYKQAKKILKKYKATARKQETAKSPLESLRDGPVASYLRHRRASAARPNGDSNNDAGTDNNLRLTRSRSVTHSRPVPINDRSPLRESQPERPLRRYGSIIGSPPSDDDDSPLASAASLELPQAALGDPVPTISRGTTTQTLTPSTSNAGDRPLKRRATSMAGTTFGRFLHSNDEEEVPLERYPEPHIRKAEFFNFLHKQLKKIEDFYKQHETEASERLEALKVQLHILRDQRVNDLNARAARRAVHRPNESTISLAVPGTSSDKEERRLPQPLQAGMDVARHSISRVKNGHIGKTSQAMSVLASPNLPGASTSGLEYDRRVGGNVKYSAAKPKLKAAYQEFYRGLELLQSYADLNKTAFRKITKKFDKNPSSIEGKEWMKANIDRAHFVQSRHISTLEQAVEDLYARYFEQGDRKAAVKKLRLKVHREGAFYGASIRTGIWFGLGAFSAIEGLTHGFVRLFHSTEPTHTQTSYLLQLYAGYFMIWFLFALFSLDTALFTLFRVNYQFVFEFDHRHVLNWKQLLEPAAALFFLLGACMWFNFSEWSPPVMYLWWPVVLVGMAVLLVFVPIPQFFYSRSRLWFVHSLWRLLRPVGLHIEFRDFFLGDMLCSLTYALGNIELFFCLYANSWNDPPQCNSSHSMLLGFFSTLPGIIRLVQTIQRYYDKPMYTHVLNAGKYSVTILQYMTLSLWRIYPSSPVTLPFFIVIAVANSLFSTVWDLGYDWSMPFLDYHAKPHPFLRETLAYKKHIWMYYVAMLVDPVLRFNWIFYVIFKDDSQHSTLVSFFIAFSEVIRRGIWTIFRVENEHCRNVDTSKALRDLSLPYEIKPRSLSLPREGQPEQPYGLDGPTPASSLGDAEAGQAAPIGQSPMYATLKRVGSTFRAAHALDYDRKRPASERKSKGEEDEDESSDSD